MSLVLVEAHPEADWCFVPSGNKVNGELSPSLESSWPIIGDQNLLEICTGMLGSARLTWDRADQRFLAQSVGPGHFSWTKVCSLVTLVGLKYAAR